MDEFWKAWATKIARSQWCIYRECGVQPPQVVSVEADSTDCNFRVTFEGGDVFNVEVTGIARPVAPDQRIR